MSSECRSTSQRAKQGLYGQHGDSSGKPTSSADGMASSQPPPPAGRPARARPQGRAQRAGSAGGQANRTTESTTSAPPEASQRPDDTITDPGPATVYSCRLPRTVRPHRTTSTLSITRDAPITGPRHSLGLIPGLVSLLAALANIGDDPRWPLTGLFAGIRASTTTQAAHRNSRRSIGFISGAQQTPQQQTLTRQHNPRRKPRRIRPTKEQNSQTTRTVTTVS